MADLNFKLLKWQQEVFKDPTRFKIVAAGRRCGKSRMAAVTLLIKALEAPEGAAVLYVSPTLGQSRQIIWDVLMDLGKPIIKAAHINNLDITLINGRKIHVRGADNADTLRGLSLYYAVLDECAFIKHEVWEKIIRASLSDKKGSALFISTPTGRNWFYDIFNYANKDEDNEWKAWAFTTADNETIDPKEIEAAKKTLSTFAFNQEYLASFDNAGSGLFKQEWIKIDEEEPYDGNFYMAVDLAGFEDVAKDSNKKKHLDQTAIAIVKIHSEGWWVKEIVSGRWDIKETSGKILRLAKDHGIALVGIERGMAKNAVMPYLTDLMRNWNQFVSVRELTHGNKKKVDRVVWALQGRMEHGRITLNKGHWNKEFEDQLLNFGNPQVHDDLVDALAYVDQIGVTDFMDDYGEEDYQPLDQISGY